VELYLDNKFRRRKIMKKDFAKIVTERPRTQSGDKTLVRNTRRTNRQKVKNGNDEDFRIKEPMSKNRGSKEFTDVLGPIKKYLRKQLGRPWNKIYSEFCEHFKKTSVSQSHLLDHVSWYVEQNVFYLTENGKKIPYTSQGYRLTEENSTYPQFYVCPETGLLKEAPVRTLKNKKKNQESFREIDDRFYKEIDDIWYELTLFHFLVEYKNGKYSFKIPKNLKGNTVDPYSALDVIHRNAIIDSHGHNRYGKYKNSICTQKRQLSSKEIKKLKLRD
jgi:hypothetical protein